MPGKVTTEPALQEILDGGEVGLHSQKRLLAMVNDDDVDDLVESDTTDVEEEDLEEEGADEEEDEDEEEEEVNRIWSI